MLIKEVKMSSLSSFLILFYLFLLIIEALKALKQNVVRQVLFNNNTSSISSALIVIFLRANEIANYTGHCLKE